MRKRNVGQAVGALALLMPTLCHAHGVEGHPHTGLIGYGISMYEPLCAYACRDALNSAKDDDDSSSANLETSESPALAKRHGGHMRFEASSGGQMSDRDYLVSLALCIELRCENEQPKALDTFWENQLAIFGLTDEDLESPSSVSGDGNYGQQRLQPSTSLRTREAYRVITNKEWVSHYAELKSFAKLETRHSSYGLILLSTIILMPMALAVVGRMMRSSSNGNLLLTQLTYPSIFGRRHLVPLPYDAGIVPTRGQALFIGCMLLLNVMLSMVGTQSDPMIAPTTREKFEFFANRVGVLSFANLPITALFCTRNNPLIRLTGWPYGSFLLYHRWAAYICLSQAGIHSAVYLVTHLDMLPRKFAQGYFNAGLFAMFVFCAMIPLSALAIRRRSHELFLNSHISLAGLALGGCFLHINWNFGRSWGYENWIYLALVVWVAERSARALKTIKNGLRTAVITNIDDEYFMIRVPGVRATGNAFLYFPTMSWRFWENHPFSIAASIHERGEILSLDNLDTKHTPRNEATPSEGLLIDIDDDHDDVQTSRRHESAGCASPCPGKASGGEDPDDPLPDLDHGLTFYVRRARGLTSRLGRNDNASSLPVLVETSYPSFPMEQLTLRPHVVCVAGGTGIATVLPLIRERSSLSSGRTALYWSCRSPALVRRVAPEGLADSTTEVNVKVDDRWNIYDIIAEERSKGGSVRRGVIKEMIVLVSGPAEMADDVRQAVVEANRGRSRTGASEGPIVKLVEECFSW